MPSPPQPPDPSVPPWASDPGAAPPFREPGAPSEPAVPLPPPAGGGYVDPYTGRPADPRGPISGYPGSGGPYEHRPAVPGDPYPAGRTSSSPNQVSTTCYRHPDRSAGVSCQRCNRFICPSCMVQASVGFHCPECVKQSARSAPVHDSRTMPAGGGSVSRTSVQPLVTYALIAINVGVFLWDMATLNKRLGVGIPSRYGMLDGVDVAAGEWWRLYTAGFLHASITHIAFNMFALYVLGRQLEGALGHFRFAAVYFAALCAGALGVILVSPTSPTVGASGAIYGLFGVALAFQLLRKINIMQSGLGPVLLLNLAFTFFVPGISIGGHLGGLVGGAVVGWVMFTVEDRSQSPLLGYAAAFAVMIGCTAAAVALAPVLIAG